MLWRLGRASVTSISGLGAGGGGFSTMTSVEARTFSPRESVQVALTAIAPGDTRAVSSVAEPPVEERAPPTDVQLEIVTGTPSGLVQWADKFTAPPARMLEGRAEIDILGRFLGGSGFTVKLAEQRASWFFFDLTSVTWAVTV